MTETMQSTVLKSVLVMLLTATMAACANRPAIKDGVRAALAEQTQYPGLRAYPGLYEITAIETLDKTTVRDGVVDVRAKVSIRLVKDVSEWVRTDGVGGLGEQGFNAYKQFRNAKAGDRYTEQAQFRFVHADGTWTAKAK